MAASASTASAAFASFGGGGIRIGFWEFLVIGGIMAIPGAVVCALIEWFGARHSPPYWIAWPAAAVALACQLVALQVFARAGDRGWYLFAVPPLMTFALAGIVRDARFRMLAAWLVSALAVAATIHAYRAEPIVGAVIGGASVSMTAWQLMWWLRQRTLRSERAGAVDIPEAVDHHSGAVTEPVARSSMRESMAPPSASVAAAARPMSTSGSADVAEAPHPGWAGARWWLGGTAIFYLAVTLLTAVGYYPLAAAMLTIEAELLDFLGLPMSSLDASTTRAWATHGLAWSAVFGCGAWAAAALGGRFEAGRLQPFRLLALVTCLTLFVAIGLNAKATKRIWDLEEAASSGRAAR